MLRVHRFGGYGMVLACSMQLGACAQLHLEDTTFETDAGAATAGPGKKPPTGKGDSDALPSLQITTPTNGNVLTSDTLLVEGVAEDDRGVASVFVQIGPNVGRLAQTDDGFKHWWIEAKAPGGAFTISAQAQDTGGQRSDFERVRVMGPAAGTDEAPPSITITSPPDGSAPLHATVLVRGTASDDLGVVSIDVTRNGELYKGPPVETDDFFASWSQLIPLVPGIDNELTFTARDAAGHATTARVTLFGRAQIDREPPTISISSPQSGVSISAATLDIVGTSQDNVGVREVKVRIGRTYPGATEPTWSQYEIVDTSDDYRTWVKHLSIPVGTFSIEARAIDLNGLGTSQTLMLTNTYLPDWQDEVAIPLRLHDESVSPQLRFQLDKAGVDDVIDRDIQKDIALLELDTTALLTNAVNQIKNSCGTKWKLDNENPQHDCSATDYGKNQTPQVPWQDSAEYSFVRLLTMTPKNAVVKGTSIEGLEKLANDWGVGGGFHEILSDTLNIPVTQEIISTSAVVKALQQFWMKDHPAVLSTSTGAKLPISLYDGMQDFAPLKDKFGPVAGVHPGLLDSQFTPHATVFGPDFQMLLAANSNLRWMDGVDLGKANTPQKDYLALVADKTGPTYDDVLEFDFFDPTKFDVTGLVDQPKADLRMAMSEHNGLVRSCISENDTCKNNLPERPAAGYVWSYPRYEVETLIAGGGYFDYRTRDDYSRTYRFIVPAATVTVGRGSDPAGWTTFSTFAGFGDPPPDQYLWELILEIGQVALHNFSGKTLPEGRANVKFTVRNIDVGMTANQIRAAMRPKLQEQRHKLSDRLLGDYKKNNGAVDFFYRRGADGLPYIFFVAPSDPRPMSAYDYKTPGFYSDEALTTKVSTLSLPSSGDGAHEKLLLAEGETVVYAQDDEGAVFRLRFMVGKDASEITVFAAKRAI